MSAFCIHAVFNKKYAIPMGDVVFGEVLVASVHGELLPYYSIKTQVNM